MENDDYSKLVDRIKEGFPETDSDIMVTLRNNNERYSSLIKQASEILSNHPALFALIDQDMPTALTVDDTDALLQYIAIKNEYEDIERLELYLQGHRDCIAYLKEAGAL